MDNRPRIAHVDPERSVVANGCEQAGDVSGMRRPACNYDIKPTLAQKRSGCGSSAYYPTAPDIWEIYRAAKNVSCSGERAQQRDAARPILALRRELAIPVRGFP